MRRGATLVTFAALGAGALLTASARAHEVGLSRGDYLVEGASVRAQVTLARKELIALVAGLDADHDGGLSPAELAAGRESIEGALVGRIKVSGDGAPCPGKLERAELIEQDGVTVSAVYRCAARPRKLDVQLAFLDDLPFGHRHLARATAGPSGIDRVLSQRNPGLSLDLAPEASPPPAGGSSGAALRWGALHLLARPTAPAFLLALLVTCEDRRAALAAAAAFAAAAAVGLLLGARGVFVPSPLVLAPAVALSLVYVGLEALASPRRWRWLVALPFGVVHGLGSAAALQRLEAPRAVGAFAAGAGLALAATSASIVAATLWARRRPAFQARGVAALGAVIAAAGAIGLVLGLA